jgi:hypothetical protein
MTRIEQIRREAADIQNLLECLNDSDINAMLGRLDQLGIYYARSGELLSEVVGMRDAAVAKFFHDEREVIMNLSPSLATKLVNSASHELNALEKRLDHLVATGRLTAKESLNYRLYELPQETDTNKKER